MVSNLIVQTFHNIYVYQVMTLYALNVYNIIYVNYISIKLEKISYSASVLSLFEITRHRWGGKGRGDTRRVFACFHLLTIQEQWLRNPEDSFCQTLCNGMDTEFIISFNLYNCTIKYRLWFVSYRWENQGLQRLICSRLYQLINP